MSYNGRLDFGLLGDYDAMADIESLGGFLESLDKRYFRAAREATAGKRRRSTASRSNRAKKSGARKAAAPLGRSGPSEKAQSPR